MRIILYICSRQVRRLWQCRLYRMSSDSVVMKEDSSAVKITEGRACILFPSSNEVFYNPVQEFNRDLRYIRCISDLMYYVV